MVTRLKKSLIAPVLTALAGTFPAHADEIQDNLPDMGTTAGSTLSIGEEMQMGDYFVRQLRGGAPIINDPLPDQYINHLGGTLVAHANSVRTPFHFFLLRSDELNAFAFFGGNVVLHSALFNYTDNESELASVMAHELSHVTQRHLARAMEEKRRSAPLIWVGALGSILLTMANSQLGMAALYGTIAGSAQGNISFTQANEQEADRIGLQVLQRSGFDPQAMPNFLQKLSDQNRYSTAPPEMLQTHPLPLSRLADTRNRANQMKHIVIDSSQDFYLAKARILGMFGSSDNLLRNDVLEAWKKGNARRQLAAQYGQAILFYQAKKYDDAKRTLQPLLTRQPSNIWLVDLMTDIDLALKQAPQAISRLEALVRGNKRDANPVLLLNLANAYVEGHRYSDAVRILNRYTFSHPDDTNGWNLLAQACAGQDLGDQELAARADSYASGNLTGHALTLGRIIRGQHPHRFGRTVKQASAWRNTGPALWHRWARYPAGYPGRRMPTGRMQAVTPGEFSVSPARKR